MEQGCKKREADQIVYARKRTKCNQLQHVEAFLKLTSEISDNCKQRIHRMGFRAFLQITSLSNIDYVYIWLANHFNTTSCSIETPNGFKFRITPSIVHKFFGIPIGGHPVITKPSEATYEFIQQQLGTTAPTIEYLFSIMNDDLPEEKYCKIFILILLSLFVAPNSSGVASKFVYSAIVDIDRISQYDWCLLCLSYMVYSIKKTRLKNIVNKEIIPGGSKLLMLISYFEFLIISEIKMPTIEPRLPLWTANMLNSYMALDVVHGKRNEYGRLPLFVKRSIPKVTPTIDASALLHQFFSETKSPKRRVQKTKFCFPLFRFLLPGERLEDFVNPELNKGWLPPEITYPVDESLNNTLHGNSNGEAGSST
ncbi:unnamed protein product [Triticum turgidum subsp. durum]|uniref:Aminotransferase-like plant mobile domain-containing protein n=1 Tax=Triticum turgidum subsp. durum TaxID=4567 RepID=A0A9R1RZH9_TRITD|nr:unnamed protein product [Triticum turgidum subsp. durum]